MKKQITTSCAYHLRMWVQKEMEQQMDSFKKNPFVDFVVKHDFVLISSLDKSKKDPKNPASKTQCKQANVASYCFLIVSLGNFTRNNMALEQIPTAYKLKHGSDGWPRVFAQICILLSCMMVCQKIKKVILLKKSVNLWTAKFRPPTCWNFVLPRESHRNKCTWGHRIAKVGKDL